MWLRILVSLILFLLFVPMLTLILMSFTSTPFFNFPPPGFSLKWYKTILENEEWIEVTLRSLQIAFFTTILSLVIGTLAAVGTVKINFMGKKLFMSLMVSPMIIPVIITGIALYNFLAPFNLTGTLTGLVLSHTLIAVPVVFITILASLKGVDENLEKAAIGLGSSPFRAFFNITVPLIRPALFSGTLFAFLMSFDELVVTIFVSGPGTKTLPVKFWEDLRTQIEPTMAAISTILIIGIVILYVFQEWISTKENKER